jgi:predicted type IV restriction endonuclease
MMDDVAFLRLDLAEVAKDGAIDDNTLGGIAAIRKGLFNPEDVGAEAKKKLLFESFVNLIKKFKSDPSDDFIKFILGQSEAGSKIRVTQKIVDANRDVVRSAMEAFVAQEALSRFGYAPKDVVRTVPEREEPATAAPAVALEPEAEIVFPSEGEMKALTYAKNRLFYLVRNDFLFQEVQKITFSKTKTSFRVYYERRNNGALFDYREHRDGKAALQFPALGGGDVAFVFSAELDDCLLKSFTRRVTEAGVSFDSPPVLRTIKGGQPGGAAS